MSVSRLLCYHQLERPCSRSSEDVSVRNDGVGFLGKQVSRGGVGGGVGKITLFHSTESDIWSLSFGNPARLLTTYHS